MNNFLELCLQELLGASIYRSVILKTYMRGGSTLFGELFNQ